MTIIDKANKYTGNWKKWDSFGWSNCPEDGELWAIVYTHNRDSGLVELSNAKAIREALNKFPEEEIIFERHSHWAVGWVDGFVIRVWKDFSKTEVTDVFKKYMDLQEKLEDYYLLDEDDHSERQLEETFENVESIGKRYVKDGVDEWVDKVLCWFDANESNELESDDDDQGGCPSSESVKRALYSLGILDEEYLEDVVE